MFNKPCRCGRSNQSFKIDIGPFYVGVCCASEGYDDLGNKKGEESPQEPQGDQSEDQPQEPQAHSRSEQRRLDVMKASKEKEAKEKHRQEVIAKGKARAEAKKAKKVAEAKAKKEAEAAKNLEG